MNTQTGPKTILALLLHWCKCFSSV